MNFRILIVDDEKNIRTGLTRALELDGYKVLQASDGQEALKIIQKSEVDIIISDLRMPRLGGAELLKRVVSSYPTVPVIILTGHGTVDSAVSAMRDGAYDFLTKPVNLERLGLLVSKALERRELARRQKELQQRVERLEKRREDFGLMGKSSAMNRIYEIIAQVAPTRANVLITGDSGTGKELVANQLHRQSKRKEAPLVKVHCAALSESLLESELFGHEKGAFTGALTQRKGRFELADGGTIFLDEIGEIDRSTQIKILRVLQEKSFERVGGEKTIVVDVRIIAATNRDLQKEVNEGRFREDLYYRLNVVNIHLPMLRERSGDILLLANDFLKEFALENDKKVLGIEPKASQALGSYAWPGNIRELRNVIESAVVMTKSDYINLDDLPDFVGKKSDVESVNVPLGVAMSEAEKIILRANLAAQNGNKTRTADLLKIARKTLHRKIGEYGLSEEFSTGRP